MYLSVSSLHHMRVLAATLNDAAAFLFMAAAAYKHLYNTKAWHRLRWHQLQAEPLCRMCKSQGKIKEAEIVDHVDAHRGDEIKFFDPTNLQSLCKHCHDSVKQQMEKSGVLRGCDTNGWPLDPHHHWNLRARGAGRKSGEGS